MNDYPFSLITLNLSVALKRQLGAPPNLSNAGDYSYLMGDILYHPGDITQGELGNVLGNVITKRLKDAAVKVLRHTQLPFDSFLMELAGYPSGWGEKRSLSK
jgi:hypothetical protein